MNAMIAADLHGTLTQKEIDEYLRNYGVPKLIIMLGDNNPSDIEALLYNRFLQKSRKVGIVGNHNSPDLLSAYPEIEDIHGKAVEVDGICFGGLSGSPRYSENTARCMFTQEQADEIMKQIPDCEILLTHSNMCLPQLLDVPNPEYKRPALLERIKEKFGLYESPPETIQSYKYVTENNTHCGFICITEYIDRIQPELHLYGHLHDSKQIMRGKTLSRCCYRLENIEIDSI